MTARPTFRFRFRRRQPPGSTLCWTITISAKQGSSPWRRERIGKPSNGAREGFAEMARHFLQKGFAVTLIGSDRERALCEEIARLAPGAVDLAGETTLSRACSAHSPRHDLRHQRFRPDASCGRARPAGRQYFRADRSGLGRAISPRRRGAARRAADCSPCYLRELRRCNFGHACMANISRGAVIERLEVIVAKLPSRTKPTAPHTGPR